MPLSWTDRHWLSQLFQRLERTIIVATQAEVDAITGKLSELSAALTADDSAIAAAIADLQAAHPDVDLTALNAAVADISTKVDETSALVPTPTTPVDPTPTPDPTV